MQIAPVVDQVDINMIVPYFQPIMDLENQVVWCYETLARLITQDEQTFLPSEFLRLVEKQQCCGEMTRAVFCQSVDYFRYKNIPWSMNISAQDVIDKDMPYFFSAVLANYPNASSIRFELPVDVLYDYPAEFHHFIEVIAQLGCKVMVDHVGVTTGNIHALLDLPIEGIKISGSLISQLANNQEVLDFVRSLHEQATTHGLRVVAGHIEDAATLEQVKALNITHGQGFYFSQPSASIN